LVIAKEVVLGMAIGLVMAVPLWAFEAMGALVDNQRGASIAQIINPLTGHDSSPLGELFTQAAATYLMVSGGLLSMLGVAYSSYELWPVFDSWPRFNDSAPQILLGQIDRLTHLAVLMGAPVMITMFLAEMGLGFVSRFTPQLQVFFLAMPIKSGIAIFVFAVYAVTLFDFGAGELMGVRRGLDVVGKMLEQGRR
jgi:type III secretion protein T